MRPKFAHPREIHEYQSKLGMQEGKTFTDEGNTAHPVNFDENIKINLEESTLQSRNDIID